MQILSLPCRNSRASRSDTMPNNALQLTGLNKGDRFIFQGIGHLGKLVNELVQKNEKDISTLVNLCTTCNNQ